VLESWQELSPVRLQLAPKHLDTLEQRFFDGDMRSDPFEVRPDLVASPQTAMVNQALLGVSEEFQNVKRGRNRENHNVADYIFAETLNVRAPATSE